MRTPFENNPRRPIPNETGSARTRATPFVATSKVVRVGGIDKEVLIQVFERRVLTYTPSNPEGWQVEMGNIGQHYFEWRYGMTPWQK